jgi:uncharacterized protein (DUF58 family)
MITKELIRKIRQIDIKSSRLVQELFSGDYQTNFKGKGMEFEDIRKYYPGDDVRNIDWNVTARYNETFVKQYSEERELNVFLLIDVSKSNHFGRKKDFIAELSATLSYSANKNNDKVGMILFTDRIEKLVPSKAGKRHTLSMIESILTFEASGQRTNIKKVLQTFMQIEKKSSVVFLISDFMDSDYEQEIKMLSKKHNLILIQVLDPGEERIPHGAVYTFQDLESNETFVFDHTKKREIQLDHLDTRMKQVIRLYTDQDYIKPLRLFFHRKGRR